MPYLVAGPLIAIVGIMAVFFVMRRKSVEKRSMYSARRQQIEHKVRAARQRTLAPHGHEAKPAAPAPAAGQTQAQAFEYFTPSTTAAPAPQAPAYRQSAFEPAAAAPPAEPPAPAAPPPPPPMMTPPAAPQWETPAEPQQMPWQQTAASAPAAPNTFDFPSAPAQPDETFRPAAEPTPMAPSEPVWTPAPQPSPPATQIEQPVAASSTSAGGWSIVTTSKASAEVAPATDNKKKKKGKEEPVDASSSWALASGEAPGMDNADEPEAKRLSGTAVALAQYAVLVVGLVMVLIGVLVMVANSHVT